MKKFFNTAGPIKKNLHYHISSSTRVDWDELKMLINSQKYFIMHAPRQTGKTSALFEIMETLNNEGKYACCYANIESAQVARNDVNEGVDSIVTSIVQSIELYLDNDSFNKWYYSENGEKTSHKNKISTLLTKWTKESKKPTILLIDEVDALVGDTLISLLRQIRAGYGQRPKAFPHSIILCGVRDIRDYRIHTGGGEIITGGSAFNIKAKSIRMGNFSFEQTVELWKQHTKETGQVFDEKIFPKLWSDTKGQPWLVNAVGYQVTWENKELRDRSKKITFEDYMRAREELIYSRATHLDQLVDKLKEDRVKNVIEAILSNSDINNGFNENDLTYVEDLGLITTKPSIHIANDIYKETIPRELTWAKQVGIPNQEQIWYVNKKDSSLNIKKLMKAFQEFFRANADSWIEKFRYKEAGPQLLLQAFLQRIINGGGRINREYALGRGRTDIFIEFPTTDKGFFGEVQKIVIETKILYSNLDKTIEDGIRQTKEYMNIVGAEEGVLIIFDRSKNKDWEDKIWTKELEDLLILGA